MSHKWCFFADALELEESESYEAPGYRSVEAQNHVPQQPQGEWGFLMAIIYRLVL